MLTLARRRALVAAFGVAVIVLAIGCADVQRTVTERDYLQDDHGTVERAVVWDSERYPVHQAHAGDDCWAAAAVGEAVPLSCLGTRELLRETDPHAQAPWPAYTLSVVALAALLWFAARRVAWQPAVPREVVDPDASRSAGSAGVALMRGISREKVAQHAASGRRHDVRRPAVVGAGLAALALVPLILLIGYAPTLIWAIHTGTALFIGLAIASVLLLLRLPPRPSDPDGYISRLQFLGGAAVVLTAGAFLAAVLFFRLMLELNGIALLG